MFKPLSPQELKNEFQKLNDEHEIEKAKKFDTETQLDRIEKKLDMALEGLDFLSKNLM